MEKFEFNGNKVTSKTTKSKLIEYLKISMDESKALNSHLKSAQDQRDRSNIQSQELAAEITELNNKLTVANKRLRTALTPKSFWDRFFNK